MALYYRVKSSSYIVFTSALLLCLGLAALFNGAWISLLPAILAISLAMVTRRILISLLAAVLAGGLLGSVPESPLALSSWSSGIEATGGFVWGSVSDPFNLLLLGFVVPVLVMIAIMAASGGFEGVLRMFARYSRGPRSTQIMTAGAGVAIFFDEYANSMIVGSAMRPATDRHKVSREKLAFLVDATGAPITGLALISTWIGYEVGLFGQAAQTLGFAKTGYEMFLDALSFRFYCILMLVFVMFNVLSGKDFGPMARAELRARRSGKLHEDDARFLSSSAGGELERRPEARPRAFSAIAPMGVIFAALFTGFWIDGGAPGSVLSFKAWQTAFVSAENGPRVFTVAAVAGVATALVCARFLGGLNWPALARTTGAGLRASLFPIAIMVLAWSLRAVCDGLGTGRFLAAALQGFMTPALFPALLFVTAAATSFAIGTSWGTMAILIPTALPLAHALDGGVYGLTTVICLGAVLDGSIFGDHCSPVSDTTIMSSLSSGCDLTHHVRTQLPYALLVGVLAIGLGYLPASLGFSSLYGYVAAAGIMAVVLLTLGYSPDTRPRQRLFAAPAPHSKHPIRTEIEQG